jgi:prepilin-type N-terminal cleavage/methylation domain-containing protein
LLIKFNHKGMTLVELLAVVLIVVILAMIAIPKLSDMVRNYRVVTASENLYDTLQYAKMYAIRNDVDVYVYFSQYDDWCYAVGLGTQCSCKNPSNPVQEVHCKLGIWRTEKRGITSLYINNGNISQHWLIFSGRGTIKNTPAPLKLTFNAYTKVNERSPVAPYIEITVSPLGNITMCSTNIAGYKAC